MSLHVDKQALMDEYITAKFGGLVVWDVASTDSDRWVVRVFGPDDEYAKPRTSLLVEGRSFRQAAAALRGLREEDVVKL